VFGDEDPEKLIKMWAQMIMEKYMFHFQREGLR
jgi:hypothetical protein